MPRTLLTGIAALALAMTDCFIVFAKERSDCGKLPGGWRSAEYKFRTFSVGYFAALNMTYFFCFLSF